MFSNNCKSVAYKTLCFVLSILSFLLFTKCEDEVSRKREYPRLNTMNVSAVTEEGATFNANLYSMGTETILNHGFVWGTYSEPELNNNRIYLGSSVVQGIFSAKINTTLQKDAEYFVRPFVQTNNHVVYGKSVSFKSLGSNAPVISHFEPESAAWEDTLTISGKNFSWIARDNIVRLNDIQCHALSASDTMIKILVSSDISSLKSILSVELAQNIAVLTTDTFRLDPPVLYDYFPKQAFWGDTIYIKGKNISPIFRSGNYFKLGNAACTYMNSIGDSIFMYKVPLEISEVNSKLLLKINSIELTSPVLFELLPPSFNIASSSEGTWGDILTLSGKFHTVTARNAFYFNDIPASVVSTAADQIEVKVPVALSNVKTVIEYKVAPFSVMCQDTFLLKSPLINSVTPLTGPGGTIITIRGKYYKAGQSQVYFGTTAATIQSINDSTITVRVPTSITGLVDISVKVMQQTIIFPDQFNVTNPVITSIAPLSGTFNDEVTIEGENFVALSVNTTVTFGGIPATITSITPSVLVVKVPLDIDSIPKVLIVQVGTNSVTSSDKFTLSPNVVQSVSASEVLPGEEVTITGINFNPDPTKISVKWDIYSLTIKSSSPTEIVAAWPMSLPNGNYPLEVNIGGYSRGSSSITYTTSRWIRIESPVLSSDLTNNGNYIYMKIMGASVNGNGYLCSSASEKMFKFSPPGSWNEIITNYPFDRVGGLTTVICRDTMYYINGYDYSGKSRSGMSLYNEGLNSWVKVSDFPSQRYDGIVFSLKDKIYMGTTTFHVCDPTNNYQWTQVSNLPISINRNYAVYFSLNDKGYIIYNNNQLWMYDPDINAWSRKNDFPGTPRSNACAFTAGGHSFIGTGLGSGVSLTDIWKYNITDDSWSKVADMPLGRYKAAVFSINDKIYIGYGRGNAQLYDFYEFDPSGL